MPLSTPFQRNTEMDSTARDVVRVLFRLAAGSRLGFGHLVRGRALARALGIEQPDVAVRGEAAAQQVARRFGMRLHDGPPAEALRVVAPDVLVIDDPSRVAAERWCRAAKAVGVPVASVHDLGLAFCGADLVVDGSIVPPPSTPRGLLAGTRYTILDASVAAERGRRRDPSTVLIALGGGTRMGTALSIADALLDARAELRVRIAGGFVSKKRPIGRGIVCLGPLDGLAPELARCRVAITGGGVSLYEAAALDTPVVAWPVVDSQRRTVAGFRRRGLAAAVLPGPNRVRRAVQAVLAAMEDTSERRTSETVDGYGASRVAEAIRALALSRSTEAA
jgi:spore coat polysaccharide biosynthesis predicted glycosyltransferase SpsG